MRHFRRKAGWLVGGLCVVALGASLVAVGFYHRALERAEREVGALRGEAAWRAQAEAERSAQDRAVVERLSAEREHAMAAVEAQAQIVAEQKGRIERLAAEHAISVSFAASEQARLLAKRDAALEEIADERAQLARERDQALAERDATMNETRWALRELDARAQAATADVEKVIVSAGLDLSRIVPEPNRFRRIGARGGPYIPWKQQVTLAEHAEAAQLRTLTQQLDRLRSLRDVMVRLPLVAPVTHAILSDGFGYRRDPVNGGGARHEGLDLRAVRDSAVIAPAAGTVVAAGWDGAFGNMIQIDHGFGVVSRYAHLSRMLVRKGDVVAPHDQIGVVGATGRVTGKHLHYEIWIDGQPRDPMRFITAASRSFVGFVRR
ncbi:peptidoglycan DD-metalloendopeptidase family protein [Reyranella sp.]|uniref:peptidoglycan DD-metalloendopeptidase family protein n=1 Tax=Reyranella sp. TaxID=1929291 RepID=UPI003D14244F